MDAVMRQHGPRPVAEVLQRARQLADAIDFAASAGVHHGMMAPGDVILDCERTGVTGVGLVQALIKAGIPAESAAPYASPQRLAGAPPALVDDIYSLAAITLELLIGTPKDPDQETRALREAQGLPERRRIPRPAPHETRVFTTIPGVDAGKLRACFAAAFSEEPGERPSTAAEFVASFEDAISNKRVTDDPAPSVVAAPVVSDEHEDASSAVLVMERADKATLELPPRQERVAGNGRAARRRRARERRRERLAASQPLIPESHEHEPEEREPETLLARLEPIIDETPSEDVTPPRARSIDNASYGIPAQQSGSRALLGAVAVAFTVGAAFAGGFIAGQRWRPPTEPISVSQNKSIAEPQPIRAAVEDPKPIASTMKMIAPIPDSKVSSPEPIVAPAPPQPAVPAVETGRLLVRSTPPGAGVMIDGQSRGITPLNVRDLAFGAHTIEVSHTGHDARQRRVTLSERRPERAVNFELRPTGSTDPATATNATGTLQVASRPSGAQVFVDDNLIGTTPLLLSNVAAGSKRLRIELSGYKIWTTSVRVEPSARSRVSASLEP